MSMCRLKPCPFCRCKYQTTTAHCLAIAGNTLYTVLCMCGAEGPTGDTPNEAARAWNRRPNTAKRRQKRKAVQQ